MHGPDAWSMLCLLKVPPSWAAPRPAAQQVLHTRGFTGNGPAFLQLLAACTLLFGAQHASLGGALAALLPPKFPHARWCTPCHRVP